MSRSGGGGRLGEAQGAVCFFVLKSLLGGRHGGGVLFLRRQGDLSTGCFFGGPDMIAQ